MVSVDNGIVAGAEFDVNAALTITAFISIALYNVVELTFIIFGTFKKRRGLYFWVGSPSQRPFEAKFLTG
jgi:hypothetical protein